MTRLPTARRPRRFAAFLALAAALVAAAVAVPGAGAAPQAERIIAGTAADPAAWPFSAALYIGAKDPGGKKYLDCGATVIAPRAALTAAHCISVRPSRFTLVVGRPNLADKSVGQEIPILKTTVNPAYGRTPRADIAILTLAQDAAVAPATLPSVAQNDAATRVGAPLRVAGWGSTKPRGGGLSKPLLTTGETVVDGSSCKRAYGSLYSTRTTICTQGATLSPPQRGHAGACYGDSGGPLIADTLSGPLLVGAVSGGGDRCGTTADYYTRVSANLAFIERASGVVPPSP